MSKEHYKRTFFWFHRCHKEPLFLKDQGQNIAIIDSGVWRIIFPIKIHKIAFWHKLIHSCNLRAVWQHKHLSVILHWFAENVIRQVLNCGEMLFLKKQDFFLCPVNLTKRSFRADKKLGHLLMPKECSTIQYECD